MSVSKKYLITGLAGSGKTTTVNNYLREFDPDNIVVYSNMVENYSTKWAHKNIVCNQEIDVNSFDKLVQGLFSNCGNIRSRYAIVFDDVNMSDVVKSTVFENLMFNARHAGISVIISGQTMLKQFPPSIREQFDNVIVTKNSDNSFYSEAQKLEIE